MQFPWWLKATSAAGIVTVFPMSLYTDPTLSMYTKVLLHGLALLIGGIILYPVIEERIGKK